MTDPTPPNDPPRFPKVPPAGRKPEAGGGDFLDDLDNARTMLGLNPGQRFFQQRFRLVRQLGRGGMGVVWLAQDEELGEEVALKFLPEDTLRDDGALEDLKRETLRSRKLSHPNIVKTYDFLRTGDFGAISMEFIDGPTLGKLRGQQDEGALSPDFPNLKKWLLQLCEALEYAHGTVRVAHRDLKPSNLMIDAAGNLKIADFGIARSLTESRTRLSRGVQAGAGTLVYMSPQQLTGEPPSIADDIYSFGATLYELLTSKPPFYHGENIPGQIHTIVPPSMTQRREQLGAIDLAPIPPAWEDLVARCLEKDAKRRPAGFAEIREWLTRGELPATSAEEAPAGTGENLPPPPPLDFLDEATTNLQSAWEAEPAVAAPAPAAAPELIYVRQSIWPYIMGTLLSLLTIVAGIGAVVATISWQKDDYWDSGAYYRQQNDEYMAKYGDRLYSEERIAQEEAESAERKSKWKVRDRTTAFLITWPLAFSLLFSVIMLFGRSRQAGRALLSLFGVSLTLFATTVLIETIRRPLGAPAFWGWFWMGLAAAVLAFPLWWLMRRKVRRDVASWPRNWSWMAWAVYGLLALNVIGTAILWIWGM